MALAHLGAGPSGSGSFSPLSIAGLQLWLKADAGLYTDAAMTTPAVNDADVVGGWADQSGNGNHATQATTANKPLLKLAVVNGKPVVRFDGADDLLQTISNMPAANSPLSIFAVVNPGAAVVHEHIIAWGTWNTQLAVLRFGNANLGGFQVNGGTLWVAGFAANTWYLFAGVYDATNAVMRRNGAVVGTAARTGTAPAGRANIGANLISGDLLLGDLAELLVYSTEIAGTELINLEAYLNTRYAVY